MKRGVAMCDWQKEKAREREREIGGREELNEKRIIHVVGG